MTIDHAPEPAATPAPKNPEFVLRHHEDCQKDLAAFGHAVLSILEGDPEWGPDTLDCIADAAAEWKLGAPIKPDSQFQSLVYG